jgi:hypothetical protein
MKFTRERRDWIAIILFMVVIVVVLVWTRHDITKAVQLNCEEIEQIKTELREFSVVVDNRLSDSGLTGSFVRVALEANEDLQEALVPRECPRP